MRRAMCVLWANRDVFFLSSKNPPWNFFTFFCRGGLHSSLVAARETTRARKECTKNCGYLFFKLRSPWNERRLFVCWFNVDPLKDVFFTFSFILITTELTLLSKNQWPEKWLKSWKRTLSDVIKISSSCLVVWWFDSCTCNMLLHFSTTLNLILETWIL